MLSSAQTSFIDLLVARQALRFGDFTLKSGRKSPYFINTGCFHQGGDLARLGAAYAHTIHARFGADVQVVFGPAYKGIPLALATSQAYEGLVGRGTGSKRSWRWRIVRWGSIDCWNHCSDCRRRAHRWHRHA